MYKFLMRYTFVWSFALGALIAVLMLHNTKKPVIKQSYEDKYERWFVEKGLKRSRLSMDEVRYGQKKLMESEYLYKHVPVLCVLLVRKRKNAIAANQTWAKHCNGVQFIYLQNEKVQKTMLPIRREKISSSWHLLCDAIRKIPSRYKWSLFLYDDMFAISENVRYMVGALDADEGHYLGHAISFWGTEYNVGQAGYLLSRGSIRALQNHFNSTEACIAGGRFWKQEDYYLGKHLSGLGIRPADTRDSSGLSTFHGYNLAQLHFPGSLPSLANYYKHSLHPVRCCSPHTVAFQSVEADKMHTLHYLVYSVAVFAAGQRGNRPVSHQRPDDHVWKEFLRERGFTDMDISDERYFQLWKEVVNDPVHFNQDIKKWMNSTAN